MLLGRLQLRNYLVISYIGLSMGMLLSYDLPDSGRFGFSVFLFLIGIVAHYQKSFLGYFVSLFFNTVASGILLLYISEKNGKCVHNKRYNYWKFYFTVILYWNNVFGFLEME